GDTLAEIQTDKAVMPMEAFDEGVVARLDVKEGDEIALGQRVLVLAKKGEDPKKVAEEASKGAGPAAKSPAVRKDFDSQEQTNAPDRPEAAPARRDAPGSNGQGQPQAAPAPAPIAATAPAPGGRVKSTPLARKVAASAQLDIAQVPGSGPG